MDDSAVARFRLEPEFSAEILSAVGKVGKALAPFHDRRGVETRAIIPDFDFCSSLITCETN